MDELAWLVGHRLQSFAQREYDWVVTFDKDVSLVVACLWRLIESGQIRFTSKDEGQHFGLPAPVNAAAEVNGRLAGATVEAVELRHGLLDLELRFSTGHLLQIIPDSSGYEAWNVCSGIRQFIAIGGGDLADFGGGGQGGVMPFKEVGFFSELYDDEPRLPSLRDAVRSVAHPDVARIVAYLNAGVGLGGVGKYVGDELNPAAQFTVSPSLLTDGVWLWRADLPYYVATYHIELPEELVTHMRRNGWTVPALSKSEESRLSQQLYRDMNG